MQMCCLYFFVRLVGDVRHECLFMYIFVNDSHLDDASTGDVSIAAPIEVPELYQHNVTYVCGNRFEML